MTDPFVATLRDICDGNATRAKWVFVRSHAFGRTTHERLALGGFNTINLRFVTPLDIALRMGAPFLVERGIDPSEEGLGPALIMRLLLDLPQDNGYFRALADQPPMAQALWSTIRELRSCGVKASDLRLDAFESPAKHTELRALLAAYERFLETSHRGDVATVYEEALQHLEWCPIQPQDCWAETPGVMWTPLEQRLINAVPGERIAMPGIDVANATRPRRLGPSADAPTRQPVPMLNTTSIDLFHAGGREAEIEEVFRRILHSGLPLDEAEIACATSEHALLAWEKALRHAWPVTIAAGLPATFTRAGRALLGFCEWIESDFNSSNLRRLLQSGDLRVNQADLTAGQAARLLVKAETGWGRATYDLSLARLEKRYKSSAVNKDLSDEAREAAANKATATAALRAWTAGLLASVPAEDDNSNVSLQDCVAAALTFVSDCCGMTSALDAAASAALLEEIGELGALGDYRCRLTTALRFIRERVEGLTVAGERPRPGHLHISTLAQSSGRSLLFVVGLEEGRVFPTATEDPVLLDDERARIHAGLRLSKDRVDEAVWATLTRLAAHQGAIVLSYSSRDLREYRETYASWLMLHALRQQQKNPTLSYGDLHKALGDPKSAVPSDLSEAATDAQWWLACIKPAGETVASAVLEHFPQLAQGRIADAHRQSEAFTEFDGHVPEAGKALDPCALPHGVSATTLEQAASCGFRHFLERGLRLDALDERERDPDMWLDPLTRGAELHDLFAVTLRRCRDAKRPPSREEDLPWLLDSARRRLDELRVEMPPPSDEVFDRERRDFLADLELFLDAECAAPPGRTPIAFEVAFGPSYGEDDDNEPLTRKEPVEIKLGAGLTFRIRGRIDRIDQVGPASFEIIDYKTGGYWQSMWGGVFSGGSRLQHALYGLAAVELLKQKYQKPTVTAGVYYFPSVKGGRERVRIATPAKTTTAAVLNDLRRTIAEGGFVHTADKDDCRFCYYAGACGSPEALARVKDKLEDPKLAVRARLAEYE